MPDKRAGFTTVLLSLALFGALLSCATDKAPLQITNNIPPDELAYYSDPFDKMREDLWDRAGYINKEAQLQNFKQADIRFENGKLVLRTQTGSFSKGGLGSKFALRGDFDIQLHCRMDFKKGILEMDMDQVFVLAVLDISQKMGKMNIINIGLAMKGGLDRGGLFTNGIIRGKRKKIKSHTIDNFKGWFRIWRTGKEISTSYKEEGKIAWIHMHTFHATDNDMMIGFHIRNFFSNRTTIRANNSAAAEIDDLKINAAQTIIEEEI